MAEVQALLELAKSIATSAGQRLLGGLTRDHRTYVHCLDHPKEVKSIADTVLEKYILDGLAPTGLSILSEESGFIPARGKSSTRWFIVDPLDGTFNYVKGLGPSAVSIALWDDQTPIFGVIYDLMERQLVWGGAGMGAYVDGQKISISETSDQALASICTGFPARFDVARDYAMQEFWRIVSPYAKVRMLGSAAVSLLHVATGSADAYSEQDIMLWDVAAGVAIVEGAGGAYSMKKANHPWSYTVFAANVRLLSTLSDQHH